MAYDMDPLLEAIWFERLQELKAYTRLKIGTRLSPSITITMQMKPHLDVGWIHNDRNKFITRKRRGQSKRNGMAQRCWG